MDVYGNQSNACNITISQGNNYSSPIIFRNFSDNMPTMQVPKEVIWKVSEGLKNRAPGQAVLDGVPYAGVPNPFQVFAYAQLSIVNRKNEWTKVPGAGLQIDKAIQCAFSVCSKTYDIHVSDGVPSIKISSLSFGEFFRAANTGVQIFWKSGNPSPSWLQDKRFPPMPFVHFSKPVGSITEFAFGPVDRLFTNIETSFTGINYDNWLTMGNHSTWSLGADLESGIVYPHAVPLSDETRQVLSKGLPKTMDDIAASLTKLSLTNSKRTVNGTVAVSETYVSVNWVWFVLPALVMVMSIVFFVMTIMANFKQRGELWKCSVLPVLYHGLDENLLDENQYATVSNMEQAAQSTEVRLGYSDSDRLILH